jgi:hypothetical protein
MFSTHKFISLRFKYCIYQHVLNIFEWCTRPTLLMLKTVRIGSITSCSSSGATFLFYDRSPYVRLQSLKVSQQLKLSTGWGRQPHAQSPTWRASVSPFIWIITFDLSGMSDPTSSYATAGIPLRIIWPRKPHHCVRVGIPTGGGSITIREYTATRSVTILNPSFCFV